MLQKTDCPDIRELMRLVLGQLPPEEWTPLSQHLLKCQTCVDALRGFKSTDTLIRALQEQAGDGRTELIDSLIGRLRGSGDAPATTPPPLATVKSGPDKTRVIKQGAFDFLSPPKSGDELGWLGAYRILRVLGSGGMGLVFHAEDTNLQRPVAIKVMKAAFLTDEAAQTRFLREARAAAAIKHDHIVTIYQVGKENGVPFLAMEFLEGQSLDSRLDAEGQLPLPDVLRIGRELAEGLSAAHARELIHRDIKPANVWLEGPGQRVKLLDFGLARATSQQGHLTETGLIIGTPQYMAPEQARGAPVDFRCDLFSLGCVLYEMASGRLPFEGADPMSVLTSLAVDTPPPLATLNRALPSTLSKLVEQLLAKKPDQRPVSAAAVAEALQAIGQGGPLPSALNRRAGLMSRRAWLAGAGGVAAAGAGAFLWIKSGANSGATPATGSAPVAAGPTGPPMRIGILHSLSGTMADSETPVVDAVMLAVDEINGKGGVLGRPIAPLQRDGQSDWPTFARCAEELIVQEKVSAIFGCWTSASRKTVLPVVEEHDHLLIYPVQYEGLEQSPNIVYLGAAPNQQLLPAVRHCYSELRKRRFFLVGSDYVFPHIANLIMSDDLKDMGGKIVGEAYLPLGSGNVKEIVDKIKAADPDVILNTLNGDSNRPFFRALRHAGITPAKVPTLSFSIAEQELRSLNIRDMVGDYAAWNYFQSIDRPENLAFVKRFRDKYGPQRVISDPMEAAYCGVYLWAQAVAAARTDDVRAIRQAMAGQKYDAPEGPIRIDPQTQHTYKIFRLGQITDDGQFNVIVQSPKPLEPKPFPQSRTRTEWDEQLQKLFRSWGNRWANPES